MADSVTVTGSLSNQGVLRLMADARVAIFPSEWYETFGRVFAEAFALGVPVVAAAIGTSFENLQDGRTGRLYPVRDPAGLLAAVRDVIDDPEREAAMRKAAREAFEARFTAELNIERLLEIYDAAAAERARRQWTGRRRCGPAVRPMLPRPVAAPPRPPAAAHVS